MIAVAQTVWIGSCLILAGWLYHLAIRVAGLLNRADEIYDRADQILGTAPTRPMPAVTGPRPQWGEAAMPHQTWVQTGSSKDGEKPKPSPGPATVPTGQAIDVWQQSIGKHAAKGMK